MENNIEPQIRQELNPIVLQEKKEDQGSVPEQFFDEAEKSIQEGEEEFKKLEQSEGNIGLEDFGTNLDLTKEESKGVLEDGGFTQRLYVLNEKARNSCRGFVERVRKVGAVATTALVLGTTSPAYSFAEEQVVEPPSSEQTVNEFAQTAQVETKEVLPSYEDAMKTLHESVMTDTNERILVSLKGKDGVWKPLVLKEAGKTSGSVPQEAFDALEKGEEIELVHTHPLEAFVIAGVITVEELNGIKKGDILSPSMQPSEMDFSSAITLNDFAKKNSGVVHERVIDPTGEWEYKISDEGQGQNFLRKYKDFFNEIEDKRGSILDIQEKQYIDKVKEEFYGDSRFLYSVLKARSGQGDNVAKTILFKIGFDRKALEMVKSFTPDEKIQRDALVNYMVAKPPKSVSEQSVQFYENIAQKFGFSLTYTPNKKAE